MRILHLVQWLSERQDSGGILRSNHLGGALARFAEVDVVGFAADRSQRLESAPALRHYGNRYPVRLDGPLARSLWASANVMRGCSLRSAAYRSPAYRRRISEVLRNQHYDAIQVEGLCILQNLDPAHLEVPVVYSAHNVESELSASLLAARAAFARSYVRVDRRRTEAEERRALQTARLCLAVSEADKRRLERLAPEGAGPIRVIPNCVGDEIVPAAALASKHAGAHEVVCVASFQWYPNVDGALWLLDEVLPRFMTQVPGFTLRFVGSGLSPRLAARITARGCVFNADVGSTLPYLHKARAALVPLRIGGGTRLKIVEAWAAGVPVISTSVGADGLDCTHGVDAMLADDPDGFAAALQQVLDDDALYERLRVNGLRRAESLRWSKAASLVDQFYSEMWGGSGLSAP